MGMQKGGSSLQHIHVTTAQTLTALVSLCALFSRINRNKRIQPQFCCLWFPSPGSGQPPTQPGRLLPLGTRCLGLCGLWAAEGSFVLQPEEETGICHLPWAVGTLGLAELPCVLLSHRGGVGSGSCSAKIFILETAQSPAPASGCIQTSP